MEDSRLQLTVTEDELAAFMGGINKWVPVVGIIVSIAAFSMFVLGLILSAC